MKTVICIVGPTAVGKTHFSVELAKHLGAEIINGDAFQVYQSMDIGTAKVTIDEMKGIPHHLFSYVDPHVDYDVTRYQHDVRACIDRIHSDHRIPLLVGGTGLYLRAALYDYQFANDNHEISQLIESYQRLDDEALFSRLQQEDLQESLKLHANNRRRVARALALAEWTKLPAHMRHHAQPLPRYHVIWLGLTLPREMLHERQNQRVDAMIQQGLLHEVEQLFGPDFERQSTSSQAIGYKELFPYFKGEQSLNLAIEQIKIHTHQFTKRQLTWFKHQVPVHWISMEHGLQVALRDALQWIQHEQGGPNEFTVSTN